MVSYEKRIKAFSQLGLVLASVVDGDADSLSGLPVSHEQLQSFTEKVDAARQYNGWFTPGNVRYMIASIAESLQKEKLETWLKPYGEAIENKKAVNKVGVVMAGNLPLVGFHDFLSVLITGNRIIAKLSADDHKLLPAVATLLLDIEPGFRDHIEFTEQQLKDFQALIATGSNNTSRYFEYYFSKYPNIIRRNRNGIAVLSGKESDSELEKLSEDIFFYYGLGCRNVSKLFVPRGYDFDGLIEVLGRNKEVTEHHKYFHNYEYNKAIYLVNGQAHLDPGNLLLTEDARFASPVSVVYYEYYGDMRLVNELLKANNEKVQCVVSGIDEIINSVPFGKSQQPELWDYADGIDTIKFLLSF